MVKALLVFVALTCIIGCGHLVFSNTRDKSEIYHALLMGALYSAVSGVILYMFVELF